MVLMYTNTEVLLIQLVDINIVSFQVLTLINVVYAWAEITPYYSPSNGF